MKAVAKWDNDEMTSTRVKPKTLKTVARAVEPMPMAEPMPGIQLVLADAIHWMTERDDNSLHAIVTDPPYGLLEYDDKEFASLVTRHQALGLVVALDFAEGVREKLADMGLEAVAKSDLMERVRLWDPLKQKIAVQALVYYTQYKEQNSALLERIRAFFKDLDAKAEAGVVSPLPE